MTGTAIALRPETSALLATYQTTALEVARVLDVQKIETPEDEAKARALLQTIATLTKEAEAARKVEKDPHLRAGQAVDRAFKGPRDEMDRVENLLRLRISECAERRDRAAQEARRALVASVQAQDATGANAAALAVREAETSGPTGGGISERWTYEAIGITLSEVPREYLAVDMGKVKAEIQAALREAREPVIPGIVFKRTALLTVRGR